MYLRKSENQLESYAKNVSHGEYEHLWGSINQIYFCHRKKRWPYLILAIVTFVFYLTISLYMGASEVYEQMSEVYDQIYVEIIVPSMGIEYNQYGGMDYEGSNEVVAELTVPEKIHGVPVTQIISFGQEKTPELKTSLKKIVIPAPIKNIDSFAFKGLTALEEIVFEDSVEISNFSQYLLAECVSLKKITFNSSLKKIPVNAFNGFKKLETVIFSENSTLETIMVNAFKDCENLKEIHIPSSVIKIESSVFKNCNNLKTVTFGNNSQLISLGDRCFSHCTSLEEITIPKGLTSLTEELFLGAKNLKKINFEQASSLEKIYGHCFDGCDSLEEITIPKSVKTLDIYAFSNMKNLKKVNFEQDSSLEVISGYCFKECLSLEEIIIPKSVKTIEGYAFCGLKNLKTVTFENGSRLKNIKEKVFKNCNSLQTITLPASLTNLSSSAFEACESLSEIKISEGNAIYSSEDGVVYNNMFGCLVIYPCGKTQTHFKLPNSTTIIKEYAFANCKNLKSIDLNNVATLNTDVFKNCKNLEEIYSQNLVEIESTSYFEDTKWYTENSRNEFFEIGKVLLRYNGTSARVDLTKYAKIMADAFSLGANPNTVQEIILGNDIKKILNETFYACNNLKTVYILKTNGTISFGKTNSFNTDNSFVLYVPRAKKTIYNHYTYPTKLTLEIITTKVSFVRDGSIISSQEYYYGNKYELYVPENSDASLVYYLDENCTQVFEMGSLWEIWDEELTLYLK